jgi:Zn-dependent M28 family amino/carboxypeptidase
LLDPAHEEVFKRYQHYFGQGINKLSQGDENKPTGGIIVIALTSTTAEQVKSLKVSGVNNISKNELTNVVAVLPGKTKPEEIVLYSAHYDHLGLTNAQGDNIYNGADDDASGTAAIINLAQYYAKQGNNARTLMFSAFSAEEIGGFGSRYFSTQIAPESITAMINIEMIGKPSKFGAGTVWMTGMERSNLGEQLNNVLAESGNKIYKDPYPEQGLFYRSDNATLARLGVPAHSFSSTQLDKDQHYHQVSDDLASLDLSSLQKVIAALATATQPLVDGTITPSRIDKNLVKKKGLIY